jgi:hypothetical protein
MVDSSYMKSSLDIITTAELKSRTIKSSLGVLPLRCSESIPELNLVHLRGRSVGAIDEVMNDALVTSRIGANTPQSPRRLVPVNDSHLIHNQHLSHQREQRQPLPAILPMVGTTHTATLQTRQAPAKPNIHIPPVRKRHVDAVVIEREVLERGTPRSVVHRMANEARMINQSFADRTNSQGRVSTKPL